MWGAELHWEAAFRSFPGKSPLQITLHPSDQPLRTIRMRRATQVLYAELRATLSRFSGLPAELPNRV